MRQASQADGVQPLHSGQTAFDLLQAIRTTIQHLPIQIQWKWVEGHQAEKGKQLDWWADRNRMVDTLAKQYWNSCQNRGTDNQPRPLRHETVYLIKQGSKLSRIHKSQMYTGLYGPRTLAYWNQKTNFSSDRFDLIMWPAAHQALQRLPFGMQRFWVNARI